MIAAVLRSCALAPVAPPRAPVAPPRAPVAPPHRFRSRLAGGLLLLALAGALLARSEVAAQTAHSSGDLEVAPWSFPVGERAEYDVTFGRVRVGSGTLAVEGIDTLADRPAYRLALEVAGGTFFYRLDDRTVSWVCPDPIRSLQFEQRLHQGSYQRHRRYKLDHRSLTYDQEDWDKAAGAFRPDPQHQEVPMPPRAVDEIAFLYLARSLPLEPGDSYTFERYFKEDGNPVVLQVLRRETVRVPAGRFETVVVRPIIQTNGMFAEGGRAEVYMTDDDRRVIVQLKTQTRAGELNMYLSDYDPGRSGALIPTAGTPAAEPCVR